MFGDPIFTTESTESTEGYMDASRPGETRWFLRESSHPLLCVLCALRGDLEHEPSDALLQQRDVEVDEKSDAQSAQLQVGEKLCLMDRREGVNRFDLDQNSVLDHKVHSVSAFQVSLLVDDRQWHLPAECHASQGQLTCEAALVRRLQESGTELSMHLNCRVDDHAGERVAGLHRDSLAQRGVHHRGHREHRGQFDSQRRENLGIQVLSSEGFSSVLSVSSVVKRGDA